MGSKEHVYPLLGGEGSGKILTAPLYATCPLNILLKTAATKVEGRASVLK